MKVVPHGRLLDEAELVARQILRNSQRAVRSAKETILEVIGKPLDDQLRIEGWNSYTCVDRDEAAALLERFYDKADAGRVGVNATPLGNSGRDTDRPLSE
jgi:enoyl-CoA hydratase/carnithine racemase